MKNKIKTQKASSITMNNSSQGFSSLESTLSLALSLLVILSSLEFLSFARRAFFKLKSTEQRTQAALLATERIKKDAELSGFGLQLPLSLGLLSGITQEENGVVIHSLERTYALASDLYPGQTVIRLEDTDGLKKKREICLSDGISAELKEVDEVRSQSLLLSTPLVNYYSRDASRLLSLRKVFIFYDEKSQKIRRRVNNSTAQPLLEEVSNAIFRYEEKENLLSAFFSLNGDKGKTYEFHFFAKNIALATSGK